MKNLMLIFCSLFFFFGIGNSTINAQTKNNYVVLSKNIQQLQPILQTATALQEEDGNKFGEFHVIFCGKTLQETQDNPEFTVLLKTAHKQAVKVFACGISLKKLNLNEKDLPTELKVTENGILYGFQLAKKGFLTLSI